MAKKIIEVLVGLFMMLGLAALVFLALQVSGLTNFTGKENYYKVTADFDTVGNLKVRAPVMVAGVSVGEVSSIELNQADFRARVTMLVNSDQKLPIDTSASIFTQGILGANYVSLTPGYNDTNLKNGGVIETTNSAVILEKLIGQFLYTFQNKKSQDSTATVAKEETSASSSTTTLGTKP